MIADEMSATEPRVDTDLRFETFAIMWAIANVIHLANQSFGRIDNPAGWANLAAAVYLLMRPTSVRRLVLLAALQLVEVVWVAPLAPDHALLAAGVNIAIVLSFLFASPETRASPSKFMLRVEQPARVILLLAYSAAAVAKYNSNFFDPAVSCATFIADKASFGLTGGADALAPLHIGFSAGVEAIIPVLLLVPRTRRIGARLGIVFHFLVSLSPAIQVGDFTTVLWPLFLLFLDDEDLAAIRFEVRRTLSKSPIVRRVRNVDPLLFGLILVVAAGASGWLPNFGTTGARGVTWGAVTLYGIVLVPAVLKTGRATSKRAPIAHRPTAAHALLIVLFGLWVLNPYLGFRTMGAFTMFSGLETEGPGTNHLFMPSIHLVDHQNDLVELVSSNNQSLQSFADAGYAVPYFEVRRAVAESEIDLVGVRAGLPLTIDATNRETIQLPSWVERKALLFRPVAASGESLCVN